MPESRDGATPRKAHGRKPDTAVATLSLKALFGAGEPRPRHARDDVPPLRVEDALREITTVAAASLHRQAAHAWAARAVACYRVCLAKADHQQALSYLYLGEHYREAALAQAAFGEAWQPLRPEVEALMDEDRAAASRAMRQRSLDDAPAKP